jgi:hypothetical protein|tara:strand:+ start:5757 stop:6230 length:474 start_codon:yes stop_codon:yes gene_type:complete
MALTIRQINATKPGTKIITLSDGMGLELRISTNGSRGWRLRYTRPNGKRNMISLGQYPEVSLAEAREKRTDMRRLISQGIDPVEQKQSDRQQQQSAAQNTFEVLAMVLSSRRCALNSIWRISGQKPLFLIMPSVAFSSDALPTEICSLMPFLLFINK